MSAIVLDHDKDIQNLEKCRWDREEVDRDQLLRVICEECSPRLRRRLWMPDHVFADGRFRDLDAQLQELAMDARRSPSKVVSAESPN